MGAEDEPNIEFMQVLKDHPSVSERRDLTLKVMTMWTNFAKTG